MGKKSVRAWITLVLLLLSSWPAQARLGENTAELQKRFGAPVKQIQAPGGSKLSQNQYFNRDLMIFITLYDGKSVVEHYLKLKAIPKGNEEPVVVALPQALTDAILQANAEGSQWQQAGDSEKDTRYARMDQRALAVLVKQQNVPVELRICDINFVEALTASPQK